MGMNIAGGFCIGGCIATLQSTFGSKKALCQQRLYFFPYPALFCLRYKLQ